MSAVIARVETLLDQPVRPATAEMAELVRNGLTDSDILAAGANLGFEPPIMKKTLHDATVAIPCLSVISDRLAAQPDRHILFAGRDADYMADNYQIRYPDRPATLLPASGTLFSDIYTRTENNDPLVQRFLNAHGLGRTALKQPHTLVDTGFEGTIGKRLDDALGHYYGIDSLRSSGALATKLVCHMEQFPGLNRYPGVSEILTPDDLPEDIKSGTAFLRFAGVTRHQQTAAEYATNFPMYPLASILQILPKFTSHYGTLAEVNGKPTAVTRDLTGPTVDIDGASNGVNPNIRNPVAATIIQARVIRDALETT